MCLMSAVQVYEYVNKNIGINKVKLLMRTGVIPSVIEGNKLLTKKEFVDDYLEGLFDDRRNSRTDVFDKKIKDIVHGIKS